MIAVPADAGKDDGAKGRHESDCRNFNVPVRVARIDQYSFSGRGVHLTTASRPLTKTYPAATPYRGYDSPSGCGADSLSEVTWTVQH